MLAGLEHLFSHLFSHLSQKFFGPTAMFGGILLAMGGWFGDWAVREWRRGRRGYATVMGAIGAAIAGFVVYIDWDVPTLGRCVIVAAIVYIPLHFAERRLLGRAK